MRPKTTCYYHSPARWKPISRSCSSSTIIVQHDLTTFLCLLSYRVRSDTDSIFTPNGAMSDFCVRRRSNHSVVTAVLLTWFLLLLPHHPTSSQSLSITNEAGYTSLRSCGRPCFSGFLDLPDNLQCAYPYQNSCVCRQDLAPAASAFITSCVNSRCDSVTVDLNQAVSLFDGYCSRNNAPNPNVALTTLDSSSPTTTVVAVTTVTGGGSNSAASGSLPMLTAALVLAVATFVLRQP